MKSSPEPRVAAWVAGRPRRLVFTTVVCRAEILAGIAKLRVGRRRRDLEIVAENLFATGFRGRVLPFEDEAAPAFAEISAARRRAGRNVSDAVLIIAAITRINGGAIVTRDDYGFELAGIPVINPWDQT